MPLKRNVPLSLVEANMAWNKFVEANWDQIQAFNNKLKIIVEDYNNGNGIITDTIFNERKAELVSENHVFCMEFQAIRKRLFEQQNLPAYKRELDKQNQIERPAPHWAKLIDEELEGSPFNEPTKRKVFLANETVN